MGEEEIKQNFSNNLVKLRKTKGLTQTQLAKKLNYSDKAISKWECGDALPDIKSFTHIARFFGVTVDNLLSKNPQIARNIIAKNVAITLLGFLLVWLTAFVVHYFLSILADFNNIKIIVLCTLPLSVVELTVFACIWFNKICQFIATSLLVWTSAITCYFIQNINAWFIFIIAVVLEVILIIWFWLRKLIIKH